MSIISALTQTIPRRTPIVPDNALVNVAYNDIVFQHNGRWNDTGSGLWTGWLASRLVAKITGTGILMIKATIAGADASAANGIVVVFDGAVESTVYPFNPTTATSFTGTRYVLVKVPDDNRVHTLEIYSNDTAIVSFNASSQTIITAMSTGSCCTLSTWTQGSKKLQCIGDSWMGSTLGWTRFLDMTHFNLYPIAKSSMTVAQMNTDYDYDYAGQLNTTDPTCDGVVISFGVNDFGGGVSVANFQTSLLALIDKVRLKQPVPIPIFLLRVPNNGASLYGQYGTAMSNAAGLRSNVIYLNTSSLDASMTWFDAGHLDATSRLALASFANAQFIANGL